MFREFLHTASKSGHRVGTAAQIHAIAPATFERRFVVAARLPEAGWPSPSPAQWVVDPLVDMRGTEFLRLAYLTPQLVRQSQSGSDVAFVAIGFRVLWKGG